MLAKQEEEGPFWPWNGRVRGSPAEHCTGKRRVGRIEKGMGSLGRGAYCRLLPQLLSAILGHDCALEQPDITPRHPPSPNETTKTPL